MGRLFICSCGRGIFRRSHLHDSTFRLMSMMEAECIACGKTYVVDLNDPEKTGLVPIREFLSSTEAKSHDYRFEASTDRPKLNRK